MSVGPGVRCRGSEGNETQRMPRDHSVEHRRKQALPPVPPHPAPRALEITFIIQHFSDLG